MAEKKGWSYLPHDITFLVFKEISYLDNINSKEGWQNIINSLLVCRSWNDSLRRQISQNGPLEPLLGYGSETFALAALKKQLSKKVVLVAKEEAKTSSSDEAVEKKGEEDQPEPRGVKRYRNQNEATGQAANLQYETTTDPKEVYPGTALLENWLYLATKSRFVRCMELLLAHNAPIIPAVSVRAIAGYRPSLLTLAVQKKCVEAVMLLLAQGPERMPRRYADLALPVAYENRHVPSIEVLFKYGAWRMALVSTRNLEHVEEVEIPPLSYAVEADDMNMVDLLMKYFDGDEESFYEFPSPLVRAIRRHNLPMIYHLLYKGVSVTPKGKKLPMPLGESVSLNQEYVMDLLIDWGADIDECDQDGLSALDYALLNADDYLFSKMLEFNPIISESTFRAIVTRRSIKGVRRLLDRREDMDPSLPSYGLCEAVIIGADELIKEFLAYHTRLYHEKTSRHALYIAVGHGDVRLVKQLLDAGKQTKSFQPEHGAVALNTAVTAQNVPLVTLLLSYGANPNLSTAESRSALHAAMPTANKALIHLLLMHGASVHIKTASGVSIVDAAMSTGSDEIVNLVFEYGGSSADVTAEMMDIVREDGAEGIDGAGLGV